MCEHCKYDIESEQFTRCIVCLRPTGPTRCLCHECDPPYSRAWCVGEREGALKEAINRYKYHSARAAVESLVDLLDNAIPLLPSDVQVVAVPTVRRHVRVRGFDHAALLARRFAHRRGLRYDTVLQRQGGARQQGASRSQRLAQARDAFTCEQSLSGTYLLIDDVYTTGATLQYASLALRDAGADEVYVSVLSRQTLEKLPHL